MRSSPQTWPIDPAAPQKKKYPWTNIWAVVAIVVNAGMLIFTAWLFQETHEALQDSRGQFKYTKDQDRRKDSADSVVFEKNSMLIDSTIKFQGENLLKQKQLIDAQLLTLTESAEQFESINRPFIEVESLEYNLQTSSTIAVEYNVKIKNVGSHPIKFLAARTKMVDSNPSKNPVKLTLENIDPGRPISGYLMKEQTKSFSFTRYMSPLYNTKNFILRGDLVLGEIDYVDLVNRKKRTLFFEGTLMLQPSGQSSNISKLKDIDGGSVNPD